MTERVTCHSRVFILQGEHAGQFAIACENADNWKQVTLVGSAVHPDHFIDFADDNARQQFAIPHGNHQRARSSRAPNEEGAPNCLDPQAIQGFTEADGRALRGCGAHCHGDDHDGENRNPRIWPSMSVPPQGMVNACHDAHVVRMVAQRIALLAGHDNVGARIHVRRWACAVQAQLQEIIEEFKDQRAGPRHSHFPVAGVNDFEGEHRETTQQV